MRSFNREGPVVARKHYCIPPLVRVDLDRILNLIRDERYFILHAPRQTGKTSALRALQDLLNSGTQGDYRCLHVNIEAAQAWRENIPQAMAAILQVLAGRARRVLGDDSLDRIRRTVLAEESPGTALWNALQRWAQADPRPLVLLIDEVDALVGDTLLSVLRQLRSGYDDRPDAFPHSVVLCGVRDLRDYRIHSGSTGEPVAGGSAFNISAASLRLGDFKRTEVETLLGQHTAETGQQFEPAALERVWKQTAGQPWLVNALCDEACFESPQGRDRSRPITEDDILAAQEVLIQGRVVHLDQLADKLREERVRRVIEPLLSGTPEHEISNHDYDYARGPRSDRRGRRDPDRQSDLRGSHPRELTFITQKGLHQEVAWYVNAAGGLESGKLLAAFQQYFRGARRVLAGAVRIQGGGPATCCCRRSCSAS